MIICKIPLCQGQVYHDEPNKIANYPNLPKSTPVLPVKFLSPKANSWSPYTTHANIFYITYLYTFQNTMKFKTKKKGTGR